MAKKKSIREFVQVIDNDTHSVNILELGNNQGSILLITDKETKTTTSLVTGAKAVDFEIQTETE